VVKRFLIMLEIHINMYPDNQIVNYIIPDLILRAFGTCTG